MNEMYDFLAEHVPTVVLIVIVALLSLVQVSKIHLNPWSKLAQAIGNALNRSVLDKIDEQKAENCRYRILRFDDEIRNHERHTEEHFNQIIDDINEYEAYCNQHPKFKNRKAISAIDKIIEVYQKCKEEKDFL